MERRRNATTSSGKAAGRCPFRIAAAPCSWGVLEYGREGTTPDCSQVLDEMAETGYSGTELGDWGFMPTQPSALRAELRRRSLDLVAAFVPVALADPQAHDEGEMRAVRTARLLRDTAGDACLIVLSDDNGTVDARTMHAGRVMPEICLRADQWSTFAAGASRVARAVKQQTGIRTAFHHHCAGYVETPVEVGRLMALTEPDLVGLCLDTGHCVWGGGDPLRALERYGGRVWHVHFKDVDAEVVQEAHDAGWDYFRAVQEGVFCELGQGIVDFASVCDSLVARGYDGWLVVEQDVLPSMGSPKDSARRNRDYLRSMRPAARVCGQALHP